MSRRAMLAALGALACATLVPPAAATARDAAAEDARILQLARRATFGATQELIAEIRAQGRERWLDRQLAPATITDPALMVRLSAYPSLTMDSAELLASFPQPKDATGMDAIGRPGRVLAEVSSDVVTRAVHARAQLAEVMTDFWLNHFNVYAAEGPTRWTCVEWVRDTIRPHALGRFRDLLRATAQSPAMLYYLDNYLSTAPGARTRRKNAGLNENYARELMELHTLGVTGGYTQSDVQELARVFTGWTITPQRSGRIAFVFVPLLHDGGVKNVLGHRVEPDGQAEGERVLDLLAREPATAEHVVRKLVSRFVADVPPETLVQRATKGTGGADVTHLVRVGDCDQSPVNCDHCPHLSALTASQPAGRCLPLAEAVKLPCGTPAGLVDADLFAALLPPGARSEVFVSRSRLYAEHEEQRTAFCYLGAGDEIARLELPVWVAREPQWLARVHAVVADQVVKGRGYPVALVEAHEQAVIRSPDRAAFERLLERALVDQGAAVRWSAKGRAKQQPGV